MEKIKKMGKWCELVGIISCPKCGRIGELKRYRPHQRNEMKYYRVDHFVNDLIPNYGEFRGKNDGCCYIGTEIPENIKYLR